MKGKRNLLLSSVASSLLFVVFFLGHKAHSKKSF